VKEIDVARRLLDYYGFKYFILPKKSDSLCGKAWRQMQYDYIILKFCLQKKIDIAIGTSVSVAHVSKVSRVCSVVFDDDDDEVQPLVTRFVNPFADYLISPGAIKRRRKDTIYYPGYQELAYLHPLRFRPDISILQEVGVSPGTPYFVMRFNAFKAHHDVGVKGLSITQKKDLVELLSHHGRVFITTERDIDPEFEKHRIRIGPEKIHSLIYYAKIFIGDSQTMTTEAALLGTPAIKCNTFAGRLSVPNELENKYDMCYSFQPLAFDAMKAKIKELIIKPGIKEEWLEKRRILLKDKIDLTSFMTWFIENIPFSGASVHKLNMDFSRFITPKA